MMGVWEPIQEIPKKRKRIFRAFSSDGVEGLICFDPNKNGGVYFWCDEAGQDLGIATNLVGWQPYTNKKTE